MTETPTLSIVLTGRNDNHGGDFTTRLLRAVRFNWRALTDRNVACEFVFVEWNPVPGKETLCDIMRRELPDISNAQLVRLIVDPRYQAACSQNMRLAFLEFPAKNVGIRRASGRFILSTNSDVFLSEGVVQSIANGLAPDTVYRAARIDLAIGSDQSHVTWRALADPNGHARTPTLEPPLFAGGTGDFVLMHRDGWQALRGFNEVYRMARLGVDYNFLVKAYGCGYSIVDIGAPVYHVNHPGSFRISRQAIQGEASQAHWGNRGWHSRHVVYDNADGWGLGLAAEREIEGCARYIEFDWNAVPPAVDLRRVVLPLRRVTASPT